MKSETGWDKGEVEVWRLVCHPSPSRSIFYLVISSVLVFAFGMKLFKT